MTRALDILQKARESHHLYADGTSICIYGAPKTGKTTLAATAAKVPHIERIVIYDFEHSSPAIFNSPVITEEDLAKIEVVRIPDTVERPLAAETALKIVTAQREFTIDGGKFRYTTSQDSELDFVFDPEERGPTTVEIFDSGSQIADSILNSVRRKFDFKDLRQYYGEAGQLLNAFLTSIQALSGIRIVVTHTSVAENDEGKEIIFPYMGSRNQSARAAKYFDSVIYTEVALKKFKGVSSPTYRANITAGTRYSVELEKLEAATLVDLLGESRAKDASQAKSNLKQQLKRS